MPLTRTVPILPLSKRYRAGWTAEMHRDLLLALDEILIARYNSRSPRVFNTLPTLLEGQPFYFRDEGFSNLNVGGPGLQYDVAEETPPNPENWQVVAHDTQTKVLTLTGYSSYPTLNRKRVAWSPTGQPEDESLWWVRSQPRPERFLALGVAEIYVEDYTDPVAGDNETFTWRSHWDKYGCIRIHNGNRHTLTLVFEGGSQSSVEIPPYGIVSGRRVNHDQPFEFESTYLHLTRRGDPLKWEMEHPGQYAGNLEAPYHLRGQLASGVVTRVRHGIEVDTTTQEMGLFLGRPPEREDLQKDWIIHRGKLLSVVLDRRDGTVTTHELEWKGVDSIPDPEWADHVLVELTGADNQNIRFTSQVEPPDGAEDDEWEHDLIPISTNLTGGESLSLRAGPVTRPLPTNPGRWTWLALHARDLQEESVLNTWRLSKTDHDGFEVRDEYRRRVFGLDLDNSWGGSQGGTLTLEDMFSDPEDAALVVTEEDKIGLIGASLARWRRFIFNSAVPDGVTVFGNGLDMADTSGGQLRWTTSTSAPSESDPRRFTGWEARRYMSSGDLDDWHPQDTDVPGTPDGLGGDVGWDDQPTISTSPVRIGMRGGWSQVPTMQGRTVYPQADALHIIARHISEPGWWALHRDSIFGGVIPDGYNTVTWRLPRLVEQWNALATSVNNILEVFPATVRDLYRDPLTIGLDGPFGTPVPWGAVVGRQDDDDDSLKTWCDLWGVEYETELPGLAAMQALPRMVWVWEYEQHGSILNPPQWIRAVQYWMDSAEESGLVEEGGTEIDGHIYTNWLALDVARQTFLYGGPGSGDGYVWVSHDALSAVFDSLGVPVPHPPIGMRYEPMIVPHTNLEQIAGATGSTVDAVGIYAEAQSVFRLPSDSGTWLLPITSDFRLMDPPETMSLRRYNTQGLPGDQWETAIVEMSETEDALVRNQNAPMIHDGGQPRLNATPSVVAWPTLERIDSPVPVVAIVTSEPYVVQQWIDPIPDPDPLTATSSDFIVAEFREPDSPDFRVLELPAGTITPETLRQAGAGDGDWRCFHVQILPRPGILRTSA